MGHWALCGGAAHSPEREVVHRGKQSNAPGDRERRSEQGDREQRRCRDCMEMGASWILDHRKEKKVRTQCLSFLVPMEGAV